MWDATAKKVAIKAIGQAESNMRYDAINYSDAITVGIMQWYATRAVQLLKKIMVTPGWTGVAQSLVDDLNTHSDSNWSYWSGRYLTKAEGTSLKAALTSNDGVQIQNAQAVTDLETYRVKAEQSEFSADTDTDAFIFWCAMYHQGPRYANQVLSAAGPHPSLDRLYSLALNHFWFGNFRSRWNIVKQTILTKDTTGVSDFGVDPSEDFDGGDSGSSTTALGGSVKYIQVVGDNLHAHLTNGAVVTCYPSGNGTYWLAGGDPSAPPPLAPGTPTVPTVTGDATAKAKAICDFLLARVGKYSYRQAPGRDNPDVSGYSDCSAVLRYAYKKTVGIEIGSFTVDQQNYGSVVWSNLPGNRYGASKGQIPDLSILSAADLVYFSWDSSYTRVRHVEMYLGDGRLIGHGGPGNGPTIKSSATGYMKWRNPWIIVRRHNLA